MEQQAREANEAADARHEQMMHLLAQQAQIQAQSGAATEAALANNAAASEAAAKQKKDLEFRSVLVSNGAMIAGGGAAVALTSNVVIGMLPPQALTLFGIGGNAGAAMSVSGLLASFTSGAALVCLAIVLFHWVLKPLLKFFNKNKGGKPGAGAKQNSTKPQPDGLGPRPDLDDDLPANVSPGFNRIGLGPDVDNDPSVPVSPLHARGVVGDGANGLNVGDLNAIAGVADLDGDVSYTNNLDDTLQAALANLLSPEEQASFVTAMNDAIATYELERVRHAIKDDVTGEPLSANKARELIQKVDEIYDVYEGEGVPPGIAQDAKLGAVADAMEKASAEFSNVLDSEISGKSPLYGTALMKEIAAGNKIKIPDVAAGAYFGAVPNNMLHLQDAAALQARAQKLQYEMLQAIPVNPSLLDGLQPSAPYAVPQDAALLGGSANGVGNDMRVNIDADTAGQLAATAENVAYNLGDLQALVGAPLDLHRAAVELNTPEAASQAASPRRRVLNNDYGLFTPAPPKGF